MINAAPYEQPVHQLGHLNRHQRPQHAVVVTDSGEREERPNDCGHIVSWVEYVSNCEMIVVLHGCVNKECSVSFITVDVETGGGAAVGSCGCEAAGERWEEVQSALEGFLEVVD